MFSASTLKLVTGQLAADKMTCGTVSLFHFDLCLLLSDKSPDLSF